MSIGAVVCQRTCIALLLLQTHCLFINAGTRSPSTFLFAGIGVLMLIAGLRFVLLRMQRRPEDRPPAWLRFAVGVFAGIIIFVA